MPSSEPPRRLSDALHGEVFGELPRRLSAALHDDEAGTLVRALLERGWRAGQLADRVGALPAAPDPDRAVRALLALLLTGPTPAEQCAADRAARARAAGALGLLPGSDADAAAASPQVRERYLRQIRHQLKGPARPRPAAPARERARCATCGQDGALFVTREVHLCERCVGVLATGRARLVVAG